MGLAVVAGEIRKLAEDSATQGKTITATLETLSGEIETLSDSSKTVEVQAGSEKMLKGGRGAGEMQKLDGLTRVITDSMNEIASGAVQINSAVQEVNVIMQKNKQRIERLTEEVRKLKVQRHL